MKSIAVVLVFASLLVGCSKAVSEAEWEEFKREHGKSYSSPKEESLRRATFGRNRQHIERFNLEQSRSAGFTLATNHLSDVSESERQWWAGPKPSARGARRALARRSSPEGRRLLHAILSSNSTLPDAVDWRQAGDRVTAVKNQGG